MISSRCTQLYLFIINLILVTTQKPATSKTTASSPKGVPEKKPEDKESENSDHQEASREHAVTARGERGGLESYVEDNEKYAGHGVVICSCMDETASILGPYLKPINYSYYY